MKHFSLALWCIAEFLSVLLSFLTFFIWAPWLGSRSHAETVALYGATGLPECDAISVNHGQFLCQPWGTVASNPWGFALCTGVLLSGFVFSLIARRTKKGFFSEMFSEVFAVRVNAVRARLGLTALKPEQVQGTVFWVLFAVALIVLWLTLTLYSQLTS